jgi:carboxylesterase type B
MQLCSKEPLFKRAISMSGTPLMLKPLTIPATEMAYDIIMKELGLDNASTKERIQRLQAIGPGELVEKTPLTVPLVPFVDNDLIFSETTFKELKHGHSPVSECQWCEDLIIGDCQHDV